MYDETFIHGVNKFERNVTLKLTFLIDIVKLKHFGVLYWSLLFY